MATDLDIFYTIQDMRCDDEEYLYEWLTKWAGNYFMITSPIIDTRYSISNRHNVIVPISVATGDNVMQQLIANHCYTLCNGMTLFIAMVRLKMVSDQMFVNVVERLFEHANNYEQWYADVPNEYFNIYTSNPMPQISEFPFLYACMGKNKAPRRVLECLDIEYRFRDAAAVITHNIPQTHGMYYTSPMAAALPYIRNGDADYFGIYKDDATDVVGEFERVLVDVGGILRNLVATKRLWKKHGPMVIDKILRSFEENGNGISLIMKRLFQIYNEPNSGPRSRIRAIWNYVMDLDCMKDSVREWITRYVRVLHVKMTTNSASWVPEPPVAFMLDVATKFDVAICGSMRSFDDKTTSIGKFATILKRRAVTRLMIVKRACKNNSSWAAMQMFLKEHPSYVYT
jgi:hypothetical protein